MTEYTQVETLKQLLIQGDIELAKNQIQLCKVEIPNVNISKELWGSLHLFSNEHTLELLYTEIDDFPEITPTFIGRFNNNIKAYILKRHIVKYNKLLLDMYNNLGTGFYEYVLENDRYLKHYFIQNLDECSLINSKFTIDYKRAVASLEQKIINQKLEAYAC